MKLIKWLTAPRRKQRIAKRIQEKYNLPVYHFIFGQKFLLELEMSKDHYYDPKSGKKVITQYFPSVALYMWTGHNRFSYAFSNIRFNRNGTPKNKKTRELMEILK